MLLVNHEVAKLYPRRGDGIGGLIDSDAELGDGHLYGRAGHVGPVVAVAAGTGEELIAATLELQVGVEVVVVLYELGILGAEAVREGLGVYLVQEFVVVLAERPAHLLIDIRRHVAVKVKKKKMEIIIFMF